MLSLTGSACVQTQVISIEACFSYNIALIRIILTLLRAFYAWQSTVWLP